MSPLAILGVALGLGWVGVWFLMNRHVRRRMSWKRGWRNLNRVSEREQGSA